MRAGSLEVGENYIFHYPYISTPCFLINLGEHASSRELQSENGKRYRWQGGVGPEGSVVAFSAICAHKMAHPTRSVSFINYRHETVTYRDRNRHSDKQSHVIYCCSEKSVYDAKDGARVLGGPAKQPLASILLEYDEPLDELYATGVDGGEMFTKFFSDFAFRLQLEYRTPEVDRRVASSSVVMSLEEYCINRILC